MYIISIKLRFLKQDDVPVACRYAEVLIVSKKFLSKIKDETDYIPKRHTIM